MCIGLLAEKIEKHNGAKSIFVSIADAVNHRVKASLLQKTIQEERVPEIKAEPRPFLSGH